MKIFSTLQEVTEIFPTPILTMGNFDGVHFGHQHIFRLVCERAQHLQGTSMVLTFDPHPQKILFPDREFFLINHIEEKIEILRQIGIDVLVCMKFTLAFSQQNPKDFVREVLVNTLHVHEIYVGYDSRFGQHQQGDPEALIRWGQFYGFGVTIIPPISKDGSIVSSTKIRQLIREGNLEEASRLLNRPYAIDGRVISGVRRGSTLLGYPTANIEILHELIPKRGVYICRVLWKTYSYSAVVNIGVNPTFHHQHTSVEAHLLDFQGNLYGERLKVIFLKRIRDEISFPDHNALAAQIAQDVCTAKAYFTHQDSCST
ncbi:riboflavin biosynthesis protein RibF [Candidatus Vecturithrix granuli]|uniref:Riboflavin biosynthesis protein n=1 Tax=Vecturithrix granuli TaxID=1499967 RepID=A0A081BX46_VECG1|nr:riboflavin biosynthesis protein RibF [Candidatus Vecturithrix granuli]